MENQKTFKILLLRRFLNQAIGPLIRFSRKYNYFQYKWEMICIYALTFFAGYTERAMY